MIQVLKNKKYNNWGWVGFWQAEINRNQFCCWHYNTSKGIRNWHLEGPESQEAKVLMDKVTLENELIHTSPIFYISEWHMPMVSYISGEINKRFWRKWEGKKRKENVIEREWERERVSQHMSSENKMNSISLHSLFWNEEDLF